ncbi:hypothetical protein [Salimicrobium halophilum]|uniref:hypothetical protein n=1 Tax=Salimicrobium halophilum TaxID=86666 RepID=UPI00115FF8CD|nr:hypothetical protein [Salimicrobium halophilum]
MILEQSTQLVPPAKPGSTHVEKEVLAEIEKVCDGFIVIGGLLRKWISYTAFEDCRCFTQRSIIDEKPFQCLIERKDIKEGDSFSIKKADIACEVSSEEANFGECSKSSGVLAYSFKEKDVIHICVEDQREEYKNQSH